MAPVAKPNGRVVPQWRQARKMRQSLSGRMGRTTPCLLNSQVVRSPVAAGGSGRLVRRSDRTQVFNASTSRSVNYWRVDNAVWPMRWEELRPRLQEIG